MNGLTWPAGEYRVEFAQFADAADNYSDTRYGNTTGPDLDLTKLTFTVEEGPRPVTAAAVVFTDKDGTAEDTYTIPATKGVDYLIGDKTVEAGTYPGTGTLTVTAKAQPDYVLAAGTATEWTTTFKATPFQVTAAAVVFTDKDGTAEDTYTIPATKGVDYLIGEKTVEAGTYPGTGTLTVTAKAQPDYVLAAGTATEWTTTFKATPFQVTAAAVVFTDKDGTAEDTYTIPATKGVDYLIGEKTVEAGTYPGTGTLTVTAKAQPDYVLAAGTATEWTTTFKATPFQVTATAVVFTDKDGTAEDTYTIPATKGVDYLIGEKTVEAGTYPGTGTLTVTAKAQPDYVLAAGTATEWTTTFKATPFQVTAAAVVFTDKDGTAEDTYTIPATKGVDYLIGEKTVEAGTYPGTGTLTVTAKAQPDYVLAAGTATEWTTTFKATPFQVTAAAVVFTDKDGTAEDTYTIPATKGVDYLIGEKTVEAGTYPGTGTLTVTAKAQPDYVLAAGTATEWTTTFKSNSVSGSKATDLNGDGKADLLARDTSGALWLYPGNGKGSLLTRTRIGSGWNIMTSITGPGDLNGDGKADLLARDTSGALWLYPGNGKGSLLTRTRIGSGWNIMTSITGPGDLNGDGKADLLARDTSGALWLYPGNGKGSLLTRTRIGSGWNSMTSITGPGDLNGDGKADLLARDTSGALWLYPGNGKGSLLTRTRIGSGWNIMTSITGPGDLNGDGKADLLARDTSGALWLYPGNGKGSLLTRTRIGSGWNIMTSII